VSPLFLARLKTSTTGKIGFSQITTPGIEGCEPEANLFEKVPMLRFMPRTLARPTTAKTNGEYDLLQNHWVKASTVKKGDKVSVINVTGCSAIFLWTSAAIPSAFHILCGKETPDMERGAETIAESGMAVEPVAVTIAAESMERYNLLKAAIQKELPDLKDSAFDKPDIYDNAARAKTEAYRFDAVAGEKEVRRSTMKTLSSQPQGF
jgi:hypothetical protein